MSLEQEHEDRWGSSYHLQFLAFIAYKQSDYGKSKALFEQAIKLASEFGDRRLMFGLLEGMGMVALRQGQPERAARLISAAAALTESMGVTFAPEEPDSMAAILEQLGKSRFDALAAEGRAMTMEQAIEFALDNRNG